MCLAGLIAVLAISGLRMGLKTDPLRSLAPPAHFHNNGRSYNLLMEGEVHQWDLSRLKGLRCSGKGLDAKVQGGNTQKALEKHGVSQFQNKGKGSPKPFQKPCSALQCPVGDFAPTHEGE